MQILDENCRGAKRNRTSTAWNLKLWAGQNDSREVYMRFRGTLFLFFPLFFFFFFFLQAGILPAFVCVCITHFGTDMGRTRLNHRSNAVFIIACSPVLKNGPLSFRIVSLPLPIPLLLSLHFAARGEHKSRERGSHPEWVVDGHIIYFLAAVW